MSLCCQHSNESVPNEGEMVIKRSRPRKKLLCGTHVQSRVNTDSSRWIQDAGMLSEVSTGLSEAAVQQVGFACSVYASLGRMNPVVISKVCLFAGLWSCLIIWPGLRCPFPYC